MQGIPAKGILDSCSVVTVSGEEGLDLVLSPLCYHRKDIQRMLQGSAFGRAVRGGRIHPKCFYIAYSFRTITEVNFKNENARTQRYYSGRFIEKI